MLFTSFFSWWYGAGWNAQISKVTANLAKLIDQFSILQLIATLFSPFHQISAGSAHSTAALEVKYHQWLDRLFSRFFGAFVRFFTILAGIVVMLFAGAWGFAKIVGWLLLPVSPLIGFVLTLMNWMPWK